jgi:hypothetical protein
MPLSRPSVKSPYSNAACFHDGGDEDKALERSPCTNRPWVKILHDFVPSEGVMAE